MSGHNGGTVVVGIAERASPQVRAWEGAPEHVGVWLERCYLGETDKEKPLRRELYARAVDALKVGRPAVETYARFFERWKREALGGAVARRAVIVEATSRVLLHPASNASVTDGAVLLHHTYGVPYLPGSGLKGVARAWMRRLGERPGAYANATRSDARDDDRVRALFGSIPREGQPEGARSEGAAVEFLDALWVPEAPGGVTRDWSPLALDVINPHQSAYYTGDGAPADTNEPVPTRRLTVAPGARFLVVVEGVRVPEADRKTAEKWVDYVVDDLLIPALASAGFGAWTSAGYGRFTAQGATSGASARPPTSPPANDASGGWFAVTVKLDPGSGRLYAALPGPGNRIAEVMNPRAQELRNALPPEARDRLAKKRALDLEVRVEKYGNAWRITDLKTKA